MRTAEPTHIAKTVPVAGRYAGVLCNLWSDGTVLPVIRGGSGEGAGGATDDAAAAAAQAAEAKRAADAAAAAGKTYSHEELTRIAAAEKAQGQRSGEKAALEAVAAEMGVTIDEAKAIVAAHKSAEEGRMTAAQKAEADAAKKLTEAEKRELAAVERERAVTVKEALIDADVRPDRRDAVTRLILPDLDADSDEAAVAAAVEKAKTDFPEFFAEADNGNGNGNGNGKPKPKSAPSSETGGKPPVVKPGAEDKFTEAFKKGQEAAKSGRRTPPMAASGAHQQ